MKRSILLLVFLVFCVAINAQIKIGLKGGLSTFDIEPSSLILIDQNEVEAFKLQVADAKFGLHLGIFMQAIVGNFFVQPELIFNSNTVDYSLQDLRGSLGTSIRDENFQYLDIPIMLGFRFGPVRIGGGPVGHVFLNSTSDLYDFQGYDQNFQRLTYGWQAGLGLDIWKLHLDFRYEGNFTRFGDHIVFFGRNYSFDNAPSRMIASLGVSF